MQQQVSMHNADVAAAFEEMAELLAIRGENPFRIRAYERAAQVIRGWSQPLSALHGTQALDDLPGIGPDLAGKISELLHTGRMRALSQLRRQVPAGLRELLRLPGLGPVRVRALHRQLGIRDLHDLRRQLRAGGVSTVRGFGPALITRLQAGLERQQSTPMRWSWTDAAEYAEPLRAYLLAQTGITRVEIAGSFRRGRETVGDLDFVVCAAAGTDLAALLRGYGDLKAVLEAGPTRCTIVLRNGLQADFRLMAPGSLGAALHYFTGSRDHNLRLRRRAQERGLKLNEYGLFRGRTQLAGDSEQSVFDALGLPWIAPQLREDRGEIEAAEQHRLPKLVTREHLQGDLHAHTTATDGREPLERMVAAARTQGLKYLAITDHSQYLGAVHGLDARRLARQMDRIDALNATLKGFVILKGIEVDILKDGSLALPDAALSKLDLVVAAVHSHFDLTEAQQTARVLRALERPFLSILAHPTGRLLGQRSPYPIDMARIIAAARARPCYLELNAQPSRLDLNDVLCRAAREAGVLISIASDAHRGADFSDLDGGIRQARRGWLSAADVLNSRPIEPLRRLLARTRR